MYSIVANCRVYHDPPSFELCVFRLSWWCQVANAYAYDGGLVDPRQKYEAVHLRLVNACIRAGIPPPPPPSYTIRR
jgi:hypothetical protein